MNHLPDVNPEKNDNLESFHNIWNMVLSELSTVPDPEVLQLWYYKQLQHFMPMAEDIAHHIRR